MGASIHPDGAAGRTEICPGVTLWNRSTITLPDYNGLDVTAVVSLVGGRYLVDELTVRRRPDGALITGETLRSIKVATILRQNLGVNAPDHEPRVWYGLMPADDVARMRADGPTPTTLAGVGVVYTVARAIGDRPAKSVAEAFDVSARTAGVWIARARAAGNITDTEGDDDA